MSYLRGLDGLRAVAVTAVLVFHLQATWLPGGFLGVDVFFVISGFLITSLLLAEVDASGRVDFGRFYLRRARRLLPALLVVVGTCLVLSATVWREELAQTRRDTVAALGYVTNWWYVVRDQSYFEASGRPPVLQHLWSLAVEEQFYLVWPLVVMLVLGGWHLGRRRAAPEVVATTEERRRRTARLLVVAIVGALASTVAMAALAAAGDVPYGADSSRIYFGTDTHAMGLMAGAALAALLHLLRLHGVTARGVFAGAAWSDAMAAAGLMVVAVAFVRLDELDPGLYRWGFLLVSLATAAAIAGATRRGSVVGAGLEWAPLVWLGRRSYGVYLWHWPVVVVTRPGLDVTWPVAVTAAFQVGLTLVLAALTYRYVEVPVRRGDLGAWVRRQRAASRTRRVLPVAAGAMAATLVVGAFALPPAVTSPTASGVPIVEVPADDRRDPLPVPAASPSPSSGGAGMSRPGDPSSSGGPSAAPTTAPTPAAPSAPQVVSASVSAFGDSVMLGASKVLTSQIRGVRVDASESRHAKDVFAAIRQAKAAGTLQPIVAIHTGNNGPVKPDELRAVLTELSDRERVVVVNDKVPRQWEAGNNSLFAGVVGQFDNAVLVDWHAASAAQGGWFYDDGFHVDVDGAPQYASLIASAL